MRCPVIYIQLQAVVWLSCGLHMFPFSVALHYLITYFLRLLICQSVGIKIDSKENETRKPGARTISTSDSRFPVLVIPTDEELEIAEATP